MFKIWLILKDLLSWTKTIFYFPFIEAYIIWCFLMLLNASDLLRSECMFLHLKKHLPISTNMYIWKCRFAYTCDLPSLFKASASLFVKDLKAWFNSIANLASFEEYQAKGHSFTPQTNVENIGVMASLFHAFQRMWSQTEKSKISLKQKIW